MTVVDGPPAERVVVCVEDVPSSAQLVDRALQRVPGVRVVLAGSGREARQQLAATTCALVLTDLNLPDVSGAGWVAELVATVGASGVPIVVVSADATAASREAALAAGATEYLTKPIDLRQLIAVVSDLAFGPVRASPATAAGPAEAASAPSAAPPAPEAAAAALSVLDDRPPPELVARYLAEATTDLDRLRAAVAAGDPAAVVALAHRLKGSSTIFGAAEVAAVLERLEALVAPGRLGDAGPLLDEAVGALARFRVSAKMH
jgi:CheY-like chemotaxis protein